jgi:hypothetical protein
VAVIGTIFFSELGHAGFVSAFTRCLIVELCLVPVLMLLTLLLPQHPREEADLIAAEAGDPGAGDPVAAGPAAGAGTPAQAVSA